MQKFLFVTTIFLFVFVQLSTQLSCWRCDPCPDPHDNSSSLVSSASCTSSQIACVKNTVRTLGRSAQISKGCVSSCTPSSSNFFGQGAFVDCCNTDFCNASERRQFSYLAIVSLVAFLVFVAKNN